MKLFVGTLILGAAASAFGQDVTPATPAMPAAPAAPRAILMPSIGADISIVGVTKQSPFTADESGETVKLMPDGNRIVENWTGKIARNSQGHINRNITSGKAGSARPMIVGAAVAPLTTDGYALGGLETRAVLASRLEVERVAGQGGAIAVSPASLANLKAYTISGEQAVQGTILTMRDSSAPAVAQTIEGKEILAVAAAKRVDEGRTQTRKESLGTRYFGGVQADGTRVVTTILAGTVGNERDIEITSEIWFAKDLGVVVYSKKMDPRSGETTYQMTNIVRAEPDASLFPNK